MSFYVETTNLGILLIFSIFLSFAIIGLSYLLSNSLPDVEKTSSYECGFDPYEDARNVFDVRFYLVSILFIVFDLEAIYFFPWVSQFSFLSLEGYFSMLDFVLELIVGFLYALEVRALDWD